MSLFLSLSCISLGAISSKKCQKWGFRKKIKKGGGHIRGLSIEGGFKSSARYDIFMDKLPVNMNIELCEAIVGNIKPNYVNCL